MVSSNNYIPYKKQKNPSYILVHHTVGNLTLEQCRAYHISLGWIDIGYHKYISPNGLVYQGRPDWAVGSHCPGFNDKSISIALVGDFSKRPLTDEQVFSLIQTIVILCKRHNIPIANVITHTVALKGATSCPGDFLIKKMPYILEFVQSYF